MNWVRENQFLSAFLGAMLAGVGALGYLLFSAYGEFSEVSGQYEKQAAELRRLQSLTPYPDEGNVKKLDEQKDDFIARIGSLQTSLAAMEFPREPLTPEQFQDKLRASVSATQDKAKQGGIKLPDKFYLGFDQYQAVPPKTAAATPLGWQLKAIELVVNQMLDSKIDSLAAITRAPLPEEGEGKPARPDAAARAPVSQTARPLVVSYPFSVSFVAEQSRFRKILNDLASTSKQFFIVRSLRLNNENEKGPPRAGAVVADAAATPPPAPDKPAQPGAAPAAERLKFIVGYEKLKVTLNIEVVDFPAQNLKK
jgi:hypothetical protein